ncbi:MAG: UvrB/UvrC motif-containing protein [Elusimicrobiales bacterium]
MLCRRCRKKEAAFVIRAAVRKKLTDIALCRDCLFLKEKELGLERGTLSYYAAPLRGAEYARSAPASRRDLRLKCPGCGLLYPQFRESGELGCPRCYNAFRPQLEYYFKRLCGAPRHPVKPYAGPGGGDFSLDGGAVQSALQSAVRHEDYERAAKLRDIMGAFRKHGRRREN